jgi:hypothetical protein
MPRRPRDTSPGIHHAWVNATGNWSYFLDEVDRVTWIRPLVAMLDRIVRILDPPAPEAFSHERPCPAVTVVEVA